MVQAYLGLGSNIGDRKQQLLKAIDLIGNIKGIKVTKQSSIYETAPIGYTAVSYTHLTLPTILLV